MVVSTKAQPHILVVDDEPDIRSILRRGLEAEGYVVSEADARTQLLHCLDAHPVNLITLDLDLGVEDGLELAREIRCRRNVPIIMITGKGEPIDRLAGLERGADDYIAKPFLIREVVLRVQTVLRRYQLEAEKAEAAAGAESYAFDAGVLDVAKREFKAANGDAIELTDAEISLLTIFLRHPARVLTRDEIMDLLKGRSWSPMDRTIDGHVARLRRKIESESETPRCIKSVRGVGYVFTADVRRLANC
jgi:DNA-binding response OmpR family regulator